MCIRDSRCAGTLRGAAASPSSPPRTATPPVAARASSHSSLFLSFPIFTLCSRFRARAHSCQRVHTH
eukprot:431421-Rhodomonas_salina.2